MKHQRLHSTVQCPLCSKTPSCDIKKPRALYLLVIMMGYQTGGMKARYRGDLRDQLTYRVKQFLLGYAQDQLSQDSQDTTCPSTPDRSSQKHSRSQSESPPESVRHDRHADSQSTCDYRSPVSLSTNMFTTPDAPTSKSTPTRPTKRKDPSNPAYDFLVQKRMKIEGADQKRG